ncbi:MAG: hypothetical protein HC794_00795 [Nitrospiraceae bacterium]|nr:hypothetical protein [Nitrospiraceae bacterium]
MNEELETMKARRQHVNDVYPYETPRRLEQADYKKIFLTHTFFRDADALKEQELTQRELYCQRCMSKKRSGTLGAVRMFVIYTKDLLGAFPNVVQARCEECEAEETHMMDLTPSGYLSFNSLFRVRDSSGNILKPYNVHGSVAEEVRLWAAQKYPFIQAEFANLAVPALLVTEITDKQNAQRQRGKSQVLSDMYGVGASGLANNQQIPAGNTGNMGDVLRDMYRASCMGVDAPAPDKAVTAQRNAFLDALQNSTWKGT